MAFIHSLQVFSALVLVPLGAYLLFTRWEQRRRRKGLPLPPGPTGWPIIGNALVIPLESMGPEYVRWAKNFGSDIVSADALGTTMTIIDSYGTAIEPTPHGGGHHVCYQAYISAGP